MLCGRAFRGEAELASGSDFQVIVAEALTQDHNDVQQLGSMLKRCKEQVGRTPEQTLADAGYWSDENAALSETHGTELFIATTKDWKRRAATRSARPHPRACHPA